MLQAKLRELLIHSSRAISASARHLQQRLQKHTLIALPLQLAPVRGLFADYSLFHPAHTYFHDTDRS